MKRTFTLSGILGLALSFSAAAQQDNASLATNTKNQWPAETVASHPAAPASVATATAEEGLAKAYPQATNAKWTKLDAGFQASFIHNGQKTTATFREDGKFNYAITELKPENMPQELQKFIKKEYPGSKLIQSVSIKDNSRSICQTILEHGTNYIKIKSSGEDIEVTTIQNNSAAR